MFPWVPSGGNAKLLLPAGAVIVDINGNPMVPSTPNSFGIVQPISGTTPTSTTYTDTLTFLSDGSVGIAGSSVAKSLTVIQKPVVTGSSASPTTVTAAGGIVVPTPGAHRSVLYISSGAAGVVTVTANPQITAPTVDGVQVDILGCSATNTITIADGTGLLLDGPITFGAGTLLSLVSDLSASVWREKSRNGL